MLGTTRCGMLFLVVYAFFGFVTHVSANLGGFVIDQYNVNATISPTGHLSVSENIFLTFFEQRQGIYRDIPRQYTEDDRYYRVLFSDPRVSGHDASEEFVDDTTLRLKIGTAGVFLSGPVKYPITYGAYGLIRQYTGYQQLSFDIIGHQRETTIASGTIRLHFPVGVRSQISDLAIYRGDYGSTQVLSGTRSGDTMRIDVPYLSQWEGITVRATFADQTFTLDPEDQADLFVGYTFDSLFNQLRKDWSYMDWRNFLWILVCGGRVVFIVVWIRRREEQHGRKKPLAIATYYDVPDGLTAPDVGVLIDDIVDARDITALIYTWAIKGWVRLELKKTGRWIFSSSSVILHRLVEEIDTPYTFEKTLWDGIFPQSVETHTITPSVSFTALVNRCMKGLDTHIRKQGRFEKGSRLTHSWFRPIHYTVLAGGVVCLGIGTIVLSVVFFDMMRPIAPIAWMSGFFYSCILFGYAFFLIPEEVLTTQGQELARHIAGFRLFLEKVEQPVLQKFLQEDPTYFDTILPFAVVVGMDTVFLKKITPLMKENPSWYSGDMYYFSSFVSQSTRLLSDASTYTPPSSSGGSSSSGGFSGGGGGGGGGGSR